MSANYSQESISEIAASILEIYPTDQLQILYRTFCWQNIVLPEAQNKRNDLSAALITALKSGHATALRSAADNIHRWGFGRPISAAVRESLAFWSDLEAMLTVFAEMREDEIYQSVEPLSKLLSHNGLGIATVSKWVCFVNQTRFAIFDSRVSIALRNVTIEGHRAFPVVGRRPSGGRLAWTATPLLSSCPIRRVSLWPVSTVAGCATSSRSEAGMRGAAISSRAIPRATITAVMCGISSTTTGT